MRAAIINTVTGTGSVGRIACGTADEIIRNGGEALLMRGRGEAVNGYDNYRIGSDPDMFFHGIMTRITDRHGLYSKNATHRLIKKLEEYDPDVIQLHNIHGYYVNYPMLFDWLKNCGKPVVWTLHDCWSFTGHCAHFDYCGCDKWKRECFDCPEKSEYPASFVKDSSKSNFKRKKESFTGVKNLRLVTPSEWLKEEVKESFLSDYPVKVINTGIDREQFKPVRSDVRTAFGIGEEETLILGVANPWRERKGLYDFGELYTLLEKEHPGKYRIAMVGLKPSHMEELPEGIIKLSHTESVGELAEWYSAADVYVNLTYGDTFPTTNIEAIACGTPVITYNAGGSPESITEKTGRTVDKGDLEGVVKAVGELERELSSDREALKKACVERSKDYDKRDKYKVYYELYKEI